MWLGRYADVIVHRLLAAALKISPVPQCAKDRKSLIITSQRLNEKHVAAQRAGRASIELHTITFFQNKYGRNEASSPFDAISIAALSQVSSIGLFSRRQVVTDGRVVRISKSGIVVFVPKYGVEGPIHLADLGSLEISDDGLTVDVVSGDGSGSPGRKFSVFDSIKVRQVYWCIFFRIFYISIPIY